MCKCNTKSANFQIALANADQKNTRKTKYGVYFQEFPGKDESFPFVAKVKDIIANDAVCCYYLSDGTKVDK